MQGIIYLPYSLDRSLGSGIFGARLSRLRLWLAYSFSRSLSSRHSVGLAALASAIAAAGIVASGARTTFTLHRLGRRAELPHRRVVTPAQARRAGAYRTARRRCPYI